MHGGNTFAQEVSGWLGVYGTPEHVLQLYLGGTTAQRGAQVELQVGEEAGDQFAVSGEPQAVAVAAERVADGTDEPQRSRRARQSPNLGRAVAGQIGGLKASQFLFDAGANLVGGYVLCLRQGGTLAQGH